MFITFTPRSVLDLRTPDFGSSLHLSPEGMRAATAGPLSAARALRQLCAAAHQPVGVGTTDVDLAKQALKMDWPPELVPFIRALCAKILEGALEQAAGGCARAGGVSARHRRHQWDGEHVASRVKDRIGEPGTPKVGIDPKPAFLKEREGVEAARATDAFSIAQGRKPEYLDAALDPAVAKDAKAYLASRPDLQAQADQMLAALGPLPPGKADRWLTDFALERYANGGKADGQEWPEGTRGKADRVVAAKDQAAVIEPRETKLPYVTIRERGEPGGGVRDTYDTEGREGVRFGAAVSAGTHTVVRVDGKNNNVDFCSNPYPSPDGRGDAVLGGSHNTGQADLTGTLVIRAGDQNRWTVKDPSQRAALSGSDVSPYTASQRDRLAAQAKQADVVLEGSAADWSVRTDRDTATYTNAKTGTTVELPASAQGQVRYASGAEIDALSAKLSC